MKTLAARRACENRRCTGTSWIDRCDWRRQNSRLGARARTGARGNMAGQLPPHILQTSDSTSGRRRASSGIPSRATPDLNVVPIFADYARYLSATYAHCRFVERHLPLTNRTTAPDSTDFNCKPSSIFELFSIIHQLYVLKSWGVEGEFAECGCFAEYSSAMLSYACRQLGLKMHIFDSFEGLPPRAGSHL